MKQNIISFIIIAFGAICVAQLTIQITNQCECSQFSQNSCGTQYSDQSCFWNTTSKVCARKGCSQLNTQASCLKNFVECQWNATSLQCSQFTSCALLNYQSISCSQQNIQCASFPGNSTRCLSLENLPSCVLFNQNQCTPNQIGYDGTLCFWNNVTKLCQTATSCSQLSQSQCTQWENTCYWNSTKCVQQQCNNLVEQNCTQIIDGLNPQTIIPCQYVNGNCQSIKRVTDLNSQDCSSLTLSTFRWIQDQNATGICIPCMSSIPQIDILNQYQPDNKCSCSNYQNQQCQSSTYCSWSNNECNPQSCNQIIDQLLCIENLGCIWQNNTCSKFQSCPKANNQEQCIESSFNCMFYNNNQCYTLSDNTCNNFNTSSTCQSQLGYCYWSGNKCNQVQQCEQITQQRQCYRFGYACIWQQSQCQQLTCNMISKENTCIYTMSSLYSNDVQPCIWQNGSCQNLNNTNSLDAAQCEQKSLDTYQWTGSSCVQCSQVKQQILISQQLPNQCTCNQFFTQQQCQSSLYCQWQENQCEAQYCPNIKSQSLCATNPYCAWVEGQCSTFKSCNQLKGASQPDCIVLSINCPASDGTNCEDKQSLKACSSYLTQSSCQNVLGNNGICFWQSGSCQVLNKCQSITTQPDCKYFSKQCYWSTSCLPASCSAFTTAVTCQYYYSSINSYTPIPCYWNTTTGVCVQSTDYMTQLNVNNCQSNTNLNARWSSTLNVCLSCQAPLPPNPKQCTCAQLITQSNCMQSPQCLWNIQNNSCQQLPCTNLKQSLCIQNSQCMWNGSCQSFTSCSNLKATNSEECAAQSLYCPYFNSTNKKCLATSQLNINSFENLPQSQCHISRPPYLYCQWNNQINSCQCQNYCEIYQFNSYYCQAQPFCYYDNGCKPKLCQNYSTKESCTFSINPTNWNYIQSCSWLNGACISADNLFSEQTCSTNTDQTARWSSNIKDGFCIPCNLPLQKELVPTSQCLCSQLLTQSECQQALCYWENGFCTDFQCYALKQIDCIQNFQCFWNYNQNGGGNCDNIYEIDRPYIKDLCNKLSGNNSLECLSQSLYCPVSLNGVCQNRSLLKTCQSFDSIQLCANSIGQEGYCTYESQTCQVLTSCTQLKTLSECTVFNKSCYWNSSMGGCVQLHCQIYPTQATCTYIYQNVNKANLQMCVWNSKTNICSSASYLIQKSYSNCYSTTAGTYHWSSASSTSGSCVSCSLIKIKPKNTCSCTLLNQVECTLSKPVCQLNQNNQCVKSQCNEILDSVHCSQQKDCMWIYSCVNFTKCSDLIGQSTLDCIAQSIQCQSIQSGICQSASSLNSCGKYSTTQCTFGKLGSDGFCYLNTTKNECQAISSCDKVDSQKVCQSLTPACQWSYFFSSCVPFQCQDYSDEDQCTHVIVNLQDPQIELCVWQNSKCVPFVDTYYRFDDAICYIKSDHTYRWVKDEKYGVRCQQCLQAFLINIIGIILLNFI